MKEHKLDKTDIAIGVMVVSILIIGALMFPRFDRMVNKIDPEATRQHNINLCLEGAWRSYSAEWNERCRISGLKDGCVLLETQYSSVENRHGEAKKICITRYR